MYRKALKTIQGITGGANKTESDDLLHFNSNLYDITESFYKTYAAISGNAMKKQNNVMEGGKAEPKSKKSKETEQIEELKEQIEELEQKFIERFNKFEEELNELKQQKQFKTEGGEFVDVEHSEVTAKDVKHSVEHSEVEPSSVEPSKVETEIVDDAEVSEDLEKLDSFKDEVQEAFDESDNVEHQVSEHQGLEHQDLEKQDVSKSESEDEESEDESEDDESEDLDNDLKNLESSMEGGCDLSSMLSKLGDKYTESFKTKSVLKGGSYGEIKEMNKTFPY